MRIVVALGGNALLRRGEPPEAPIQRRHVDDAAAAIAELARVHDVVLTHGNGPQVGLLALQSDAYRDVHPYPLDVLGAESEGMIGYLLAQALRNRLPGREVATVLTQVVVDADDPAFAAPTKPIGPVYDEETARALAARRAWSVARDGAQFRRVVASPNPLEIVELESIRALVDAGVLTICAGGGGIPVVRSAAGGLDGVEAVIDKDLAAALLASELDADLLLVLTDVDAVYDGWGTSAARAIRLATPEALRARDFASGSMAPKIEAVCRFVERGHGTAGVGALEDAAAIVARRAGTVVMRDLPQPRSAAPPMAERPARATLSSR